MTLAQKVALNSGAQALRQAYVAVIGIVSVAIASRYLPIEEYGQILAAVAVVTVFAVAGDLGITATTARMIAQDPDQRTTLISSAFWTWIGTCLTSSAVVLLITALSYPGSDEALTRQAVVIILVCSTVLTPFFGLANVTAIVEQRVWLLAIGTTTARTLSLGVTILAVALDWGPIGIAWGVGLGFLLDALFGVALVRPHLPLRWPDWSPIRLLLAGAIPLGAVMIVDGLYFRLDAYLLSVLSSSAEVAIYGIGYRAFEALAMLPSFVMVTLLPVLAAYKPDDPHFSALVQKAFTTMCVLAAPLAGFAVLGGEAMTLLGGSQYSEGGLVLGFILASVAVGCLNGVFGNTLVAQGRPGVLLKVSILNLGVNGVANVIAIPLWGAKGAGAALLVSEISSLLCTMFVYRKVAPLPRVEHLPALLTAVALMVLAMSARFLLPESDLLRVAVAGVAGISVYLGTLVLLKALPPYITEPVSAGLGRLRRQPA